MIHLDNETSEDTKPRSKVSTKNEKKYILLALFVKKAQITWAHFHSTATEGNVDFVALTSHIFFSHKMYQNITKHSSETDIFYIVKIQYLFT